MTTRGTKPIPNEIKQRIGTYRADRHGQAELATLTQVPGIPEPPQELEERGLEAWVQIFTNATWVHKETDRITVELLCSNLDEREALRAQLENDPDNWRTRAGLRELEKAIRSELAALGLNPSDRARYGFAVVKTESKLQQIMNMKKSDYDREEAQKEYLLAKAQEALTAG